MSLLDRFFMGIDKKQAISWAFFDFANSSYSLIIITFIFPIYFREVIFGSAYGDFYWGLTYGLSIFLGGISAPIIGAIADYDNERKKKFVSYTMMAVIGTALLYFTGPRLFFLGVAIFAITNYFYELAIVFYDSFLVNVSTEQTAGRISGLGWGLGYLGGIIAMFLFRSLFDNGYAGRLDPIYRLTFPMTALFFLVFAIPAFIFIKEKTPENKKFSQIELAKIGIFNTIKTIKEINLHRNIAWFLVAFYLFHDALATLFAFITIYARATFALPFSEIATILIIIQLIGFPSSVFFGVLSDLGGRKKILLTTLVIWVVIIFMLSIATEKIVFYVAAIMAGLVVGSSQAVARSWLSRIIPKEKRSEFFGFNGFASKVAAMTGPIMFGSISSFTGNQRLAMLALAPFFILSFIIFSRLKEE